MKSQGQSQQLFTFIDNVTKQSIQYDIKSQKSSKRSKRVKTPSIRNSYSKRPRSSSNKSRSGNSILRSRQQNISSANQSNRQNSILKKKTKNKSGTMPVNPPEVQVTAHPISSSFNLKSPKEYESEMNKTSIYKRDLSDFSRTSGRMKRSISQEYLQRTNKKQNSISFSAS